MNSEQEPRFAQKTGLPEGIIVEHGRRIDKASDLMGQFLKLVEGNGKLVEVAIEAEKARREAETKKTPPATQIISAPETSVSEGYKGIRDMWRPLEALVLQGSVSVGGKEPFRNMVFERISDAIKYIYKNSGYNDPGDIKWAQRENKGWSNNSVYICNSCNAVQIKDAKGKEKLTALPEYLLICDAFKKAGVLLHSDTASCSEFAQGASEHPSYVPGGDSPQVAKTKYTEEDIKIVGQERLKKIGS